MRRGRGRHHRVSPAFYKNLLYKLLTYRSFSWEIPKKSLPVDEAFGRADTVLMLSGPMDPCLSRALR